MNNLTAEGRGEEFGQTTVDSLTKKLELTKAEAEVMRLNMQHQQAELDMKAQELEETKASLNEMTQHLRETRNLLQASLELQARYEDTAKRCTEALRGFLNRWLTPKNQACAWNMLCFHKPDKRAELIIAILNYLIFGKKTRLSQAVSEAHFRIICQRIDEDAITLPSHSLMVKLLKKYGFFEPINQG